MSWSNVKGFNFRESNAFVSDDGTNRIPDIGQIYPREVTIDGDTFNVGWDTDKTLATGSDQVRDRNASLDPRLAGIAFIGNSTSGASKYRINLPSTGNYQLRLAAGDADNQRSIYLRVLDNTTALATYTNVTTLTGEWMDATGTVRTSAANWVSNNAALAISMSTTTLFIEIGTVDGTGSDISALSHISIVQSASSYSLTADQGSYSLTGQEVLFITGGRLVAEQGSYSLIGSDALRDVSMVAETGSYALSGQDAALVSALILLAQQGSYTFTGQATNLIYSAAASIRKPRGRGRFFGSRLSR